MKSTGAIFSGYLTAHTFTCKVSCAIFTPEFCLQFSSINCQISHFYFPNLISFISHKQYIPTLIISEYNNIYSVTFGTRQFSQFCFVFALVLSYILFEKKTRFLLTRSVFIQIFNSHFPKSHQTNSICVSFFTTIIMMMMIL